MSIEDKHFVRPKKCISCHSTALKLIHDFGSIPIADKLIEEKNLVDEEITLPLSLSLCMNCGLCQINEIVEPNVLFGSHYPYYTSVSKAITAHFTNSARRIIEQYPLKESSLVVELASNDGIMLEVFKSHGMQVLGVDPSSGPAELAIGKGIPTIIDFFSNDLACQIIDKAGQADIILANNVLAHVSNLNSFVQGISTLLKKEGAAIIEVPYVVDMVNNIEFDTIFHQHICYFSLSALKHLFERHALFINKVERTSVHGGSLRLYINPYSKPEQSVLDLLALEKELKVNEYEYFNNFSTNIESLKSKLTLLLSDLKKEGRSIVGYGAAGKANTLLSYFGIGAETLDYLVDLSPYKQNKYFTGNKLFIRLPEIIFKDPPDYLLILAWNFADEIMEQLVEYKKSGGKFIIPIPELKVI